MNRFAGNGRPRGNVAWAALALVPIAFAYLYASADTPVVEKTGSAGIQVAGLQIVDLSESDFREGRPVNCKPAPVSGMPAECNELRCKCRCTDDLPCNADPPDCAPPACSKCVTCIEK